MAASFYRYLVEMYTVVLAINIYKEQYMSFYFTHRLKTGENLIYDTSTYINYMSKMPYEEGQTNFSYIRVSTLVAV